MWRLLPLLAVFAISDFQVVASRHYAVNIGPEVLEREQDAVRLAMYAWTTAMPRNAYLKFVEVPACKDPPDGYELICVHVEDLPHIREATGLPNAVAYTGHYPTYWHIALPEDQTWLDDRYLLRAASHELGHAMRLPHSHISGTVMYPSVDHGAIVPTRRDIESWTRVRR